MAKLLGGGCGGGDDIGRQAAELVFLEVGDPALLVGQQVVGELRLDVSQLLVDGGVAGLSLVVERGARELEAVIGDVEQALLLRAGELIGRTFLSR